MSKLIHKPAVNGQSVVDRVLAAKHTVAGSSLAKIICKATTEEVMGPKRKHLDYLLQCTNEPNVSIPEMANLLIERTQNGNWVVVFKALITVHNLMNYGNERFTQFLASNGCSFSLSGFADRGGTQAYDMSLYVRRYAKYLNEKALSYRQMAFDFCRVKRGKEDGLVRTMNTENLLRTLPVLQTQLDMLVEFGVTSSELTNGVINAAFLLLFKDLIRLFACYNDGIINLLEKYFEMNQKNCREALDIYKRFLLRMDNVCDFLKVAEVVGIDKGDIPDLAKAPSSLLEALEQYLASLESNKKTGAVAPKMTSAVSNAISSYAAASKIDAGAGNDFTQLSEQERHRILEEEQRQLEEMKQRKMKEAIGCSPGNESSTVVAATTVASASTSSVRVSEPTAIDFFGSMPSTSAAKSDLLSQSPFMPYQHSNPLESHALQDPFLSLNLSSELSFSDNSNVFAAAANPFVPVSQPFTASFPAQPPNQMKTHASFESIFSLKPDHREPTLATSPSSLGAASVAFPTVVQPATASSSSSNVWNYMTPSTGQDILKPMSSSGTSCENGNKPADKQITSDLDSSLAYLAGNLNIRPSAPIKKTELQWSGKSPEKRLTGAPVNSMQGFNIPPSSTMPQFVQPTMFPSYSMSMVPQPQQVIFQPVNYDWAATAQPQPFGVFAPTSQSNSPAKMQQTVQNNPFGLL